ncbi:MAG: DUF4340 domain-containing protein [Lachnospiraceae bacterium]|nr:DUF4340 domain-containing protein [Lachnospiraceae bacterium]
MKKKKFIDFFEDKGYIIVLAVLALVMFIVTGRFLELQEGTEDGLSMEETIMNLESEDITSIGFRSSEDGELYLFVQDSSGSWYLGLQPDIAIVQEAPQYFVELCKNITSYYKTENVEDFSKYGISDDGACLLIVTADESYQIFIGDENSTLNCYYARFAGEDTLYGLSSEYGEMAAYTLEELILDE